MRALIKNRGTVRAIGAVPLKHDIFVDYRRDVSTASHAAHRQGRKT